MASIWGAVSGPRENAGYPRPVVDDLVIDARVTIPGSDLEWTAVRASGPGGQNVNKVATKVDLRFDVDGTRALDGRTKQRLRDRVGERNLDANGRVIVTSQATRQRERNIEDAREKLRVLILEALNPPKPRKATRPSRAVHRRRLDEKRQQGEKKKSRGKVDY